MSNVISKILSAIAKLGSGAGTTGCYVLWLDEPTAPTSIIEK